MNRIPLAWDSTDVYPDPLSREKNMASQLADRALTEGIQTSRLFTNLSLAITQDIVQEVRREREEMETGIPSV